MNLPGVLDRATGGWRILIVADDLLARTGLATLISERTPHTVVGQLPGIDAADGLVAYVPDLIVWDLGWEAVALERLAELADPAERTAPILAMIADRSQAQETWLAGARGIFLRSGRIETLLAGLDAVARDLIVIDPAFAESLLTVRDRPAVLPAEALTARESEVLQYLAQGLSNKTIARRLSISESTVKFHVNGILSKLGAQSRTDAVVRANQMGLVML